MDTADPKKTLDALGSRLRTLAGSTRFTIAGLLFVAAIAYAALFASAYLHLTPPNSLAPDPRELQSILLDAQKPISRIERLLESTAGEMNRGGTMRPAFTEQSLGWESLIENMTTEQKTALHGQREAERLALLDWVRSGASREAYESDSFELHNFAAANQITKDYLLQENTTSPKRIKIRTLITERCVTCHGENGRHDTARYIALDTYDRLAPHLQPETSHAAARFWLISALVGLYPLALLSGLAFYFTGHPLGARRLLLATTFVALGGMSACWLAGRPTSYAVSMLLTSSAVAVVGALVQTIASLSELLHADRS